MKIKKCRPVLVESKEQTILALDSFNKLFYCDSKFNFKDCKYQQLILISLDPDEKIEVGDKVYHPNTGLVEVIEIERLISYSNYKFKTIDERCWICDLTNETKKVIATQSQIPPKYISKFIEQYNNDCVEDLEIEMEETINAWIGEEIQIQPKLTNNFVTIAKKPNEFGICGKCKCTKECVNEPLCTKLKYQQIIDIVGGEEAFCKLAGINKELKLYTEEEVKQKFIWLLKDMKFRDDFSENFVINWFEQNKKR